MKSILNAWNSSGDIHHAYLISDKGDEAFSELITVIEQITAAAFSQDPDCRILKFDTFGIDEARQLKKDQTLATVSKKQFFLIRPNTITTEAQNALLKVFEEPARDTHFFIFIEEEALLPTLRSRMIKLSYKSTGDKTLDAFTKRFLGADIKERLLSVRDIVDKNDKEQALLLLNGLESAAHKMLRKKDDTLSIEEIEFTLSVIKETRRFLKTRGSNMKILLDNLVLTVTAPSF